MSRVRVLSNADVVEAALAMAESLPPECAVYGVPRGGIPVAYLIAGIQGGCTVADSPEAADVIVDDIIDSGLTARKYAHHRKPFLALFNRKNLGDEWLVFPWEATAEAGIEDHITRLLRYVGEDPQRGGLQETPHRVAKAWTHWTRGYAVDIPGLFKTFEDGAQGCDELVAVCHLPFYSHCEHHLAPFFGTATIGYIPTGKVVGLSKLGRLLDAYAARLQVQERLTNQIADAMVNHLQPKGVGVVVHARHLCMESRGICKQGHETVTSAVRGVLREHPSTRAEFLALANGGKA